MRLLPLVLLTTSCASSSPDPALAAPQPETPVATTEYFTFYSRVRFNLHDRLVRWAEGDQTEHSCIANLSAGERRTWDDAVVAFHQLSSPGLGKRGLRVRLHLAAPDLDLDEPMGPVPSWYLAAMRSAEPIYRRCFWSKDDARNRAWIAAVLPMLRKTEGFMAERISKTLRLPWKAKRFPVDVVPYVNFGGGNTVLGRPPHTMISTAFGERHAFESVEALFHEASHTVLTPRSGGVLAAVREATNGTGRVLPRDLWHGLLFYTAGDAAEKAAKEVLGEEYRQFMYSAGLFERAWPEMADALETTWQSYLDGKIDLKTAAKEMATKTGRHAEDGSPAAFMAGCWRSVRDGLVVTERWSSADGRLMLGSSLTQKAGVPLMHEYLRIENSEAGLVYLAQPKGRSPAIPFRLVDSSDVRLVFENPNHDFPKRIAYTRHDQFLTAEISGDSKEQSWRFWKVACD